METSNSEHPMLLNEHDLKKLVNVPELEASFSNMAGMLWELLGQYVMPTTFVEA
jgi:hypothetical protein